MLSDNGRIDSFIGALCEEMLRRADSFGKFTFDSIYFGGGTPSVLSAEEIDRILSALRSSYRLDHDAEISIECNPSSVDFEKFKEYLELGINRISLGVQSFDDKYLKTLGRIHDSSTAVNAFHEARSAGYENISIDLIYGIPGQSPKDWENDLRTTVDLSPDHISAYNLIIEPETEFGKLYRDGKLDLPSEDDQRRMYYTLIELMEKCGLERYELSNFAASGKCCRHNIKYWENNPYLGLGPSAVSFDGQVRQRNIPDLALYVDLITGKQPALEYSERIDRLTALEERVMMGLRLSRGLSVASLIDEFDYDIVSEKHDEIERLVEEGYLEFSDGFLRISRSGLFISDEITVKLI